MRILRQFIFVGLAAYFSGGCAAWAQRSFTERLWSRNERMTALQPTWMAPLIQTDARLAQAVRFSFSNSTTSSGSRTTNYGNYHTLGLLLGDRVQLNLIAPPYVQNNSATAKDGFGDTQVEGKYRIVSGNAAHGNYELTGKLTWNAATGSHKNGVATDYWSPLLAAGREWGRFNVQATLGGTLPTGKIAQQGRAIDWNTTAQVLLGTKLWLDVEDNAIFNFGGPQDGTVENFVTPAGFYVVRRKGWKPTHAIFVPGVGMQIATSRFHTYNHNLIPELRILF